MGWMEKPEPAGQEANLEAVRWTHSHEWTCRQCGGEKAQGGIPAPETSTRSTSRTRSSLANAVCRYMCPTLTQRDTGMKAKGPRYTETAQAFPDIRTHTYRCSGIHTDTQTDTPGHTDTHKHTETYTGTHTDTDDTPHM